MLRRLEPEIGCWYEDYERNSLFEVVSLDEDSVAIQYFDGEVEEFELEAFLRLPLNRAEQPEDWTGPYEMDSENLDDTEFGPMDSESHYRFEGYDHDTMQFIDDAY